MISKPLKKHAPAASVSRNEELVREIRYLRTVAKEVVDRYSLRVNASLMDITRIVESKNAKKGTVRKPHDKAMREMLVCIRSLKVKPKKGRTKDLVRIEAIVKKLGEMMPSQP